MKRTLLFFLAACGSAGESGQPSAAITSGPGAALEALDPALDGPMTISEKDATIAVSVTGDKVAAHAAYPQSIGSYPVIVFAHGFKLPPTQYYSYLRRLASFGYVALTVDYPDSYLGNDNPREASDLLAGVDWAKTDVTLAARADATRVGMSGHSLGGKLALLAATMDRRVKAAITLDPVDGGGGSCSPPKCVEVAALMPRLQIPTAFLGETTDGTGGRACAPAADNFTTFYVQTNSPSLSVQVLGASHMSFLDDVGQCGLVCSFCQKPTLADSVVGAMSRAYVVAFYERWLRQNTAYDDYLTGSKAQARYVVTNQAQILSK